MKNLWKRMDLKEFMEIKDVYTAYCKSVFRFKIDNH